MKRAERYMEIMSMNFLKKLSFSLVCVILGLKMAHPLIHSKDFFIICIVFLKKISFWANGLFWAQTLRDFITLDPLYFFNLGQ